MKKAKVYIALLHYPMYNKQMDIVTTSITNLDLHDIARVARTYDAENFFVVHPAENQHRLLKEIISYWQEGYGGTYNPDRKDAFNIVKLVATFEEAREIIRQETGQDALTIATDARVYPHTIAYKDMKNKITAEAGVYLILFGTGWGIAEELMLKCDYILEPIEPKRSYNHLSVRSAVAIILDRLLGEN